MTLHLSALALLGACDETEGDLDGSVGGWFGGAGASPGGPGGGPGGGDASPPGTGGGAALGGTSGGVAGGLDAGSNSGAEAGAVNDAAMGSAEAGAANDAAMGSADGGSIGTDGSASADGAAGSDAAAGSGDGGGSGSGPLPLPAPTAVGPYEVVEEENVGKGFENPINVNDTDDTACLSFIQSFGQDAQTNTDYAKIPPGHDMALYTLYRPKELRAGVKYPVISWANGTCAHPIGYAKMFHHIVSHGFVIVAAHSRYTGSGQEQIRGLDWLIAQNDNASSPLYGKLDTATVGIFGHSQGGMSTSIAAGDPRVDSVILMHGSAGGDLHSPTLYLSSDIEALLQYPSYLFATVPSAYGKLNNSDHITMMVEHERMAPEVTAWFRYTLLKDAEAKKWFVGADCVLCRDSEWEYEAKDLQ